ncbi:hypothetical protein V2J23_15835 [Geobacillus thermoleovorans]|uniref:hypothetical protein n=1 Tax=Geobacillus thermoleovorans TaxID=33941 RepID=UPI00345C0B03
MVRSYGFDVCGALVVFLVSFLFPTFYVGYYAYGSFLGFAIGSLIVGWARMRWNPHGRFGGLLVGSFLIVAASVVIIRLFPIEIRDVWDLAMPYVNAVLNALIYLLITGAFRLWNRRRQGKALFTRKETVSKQRRL